MRDFGPHPDPAALRGRQPRALRPGGLGIPLIRRVMDVVEYDLSSPVGTELRMVKRRRRRQGAR